MTSLASNVDRIAEALIKGQAPVVKALVQESLNEGIDPEIILNEGLIAGMNVIGKKFKNDEIFLPEVMISARAMHAGLEVLDPVLSNAQVQPRGKLVIGTVRGDLHDIGKNLVSMMFRGAGFEVIDLGIDVPEEKFVEAVRNHEPDILALSALLTMTLPMMKTTIDALEAAGVRNLSLVMVGGAPVTEKFAKEIGADGYAPDAASAVEKALELMRSR